MPLAVVLNGSSVEVDLEPGATLSELVALRSLKADRVAIERNGEIVPRGSWPVTPLEPGDRLEIVHFVGGGCVESSRSSRSH